MLFVLWNCAFFHFQVAGPFVKVWRFMKADRQPGAGCECWSKAGWTNVCTHTSIVSLAARGDVKHNDVVRGCRRAPRSLRGSHDAHKSTRKDTDSYTRKHMKLYEKTAHSFAIQWLTSTHPDTTHTHTHILKGATRKQPHQPDPRSDWNDHLSLANKANVRTIHLTLLSNFNNSIIVLHMSGPRSLDNPANRFKVPQIH